MEDTGAALESCAREFPLTLLRTGTVKIGGSVG